MIQDLLESTSLRAKVRQYLQITKAYLLKFLEEIQKASSLSPDQKKLMEDKINKIFLRQLNYTNKNDRKELFRQLNSPLIKLEYSMNFDDRLCESKGGKGIIQSITRFINGFTMKAVKPSVVSNVLIGGAISISLITLSGLGYTLYQEKQRDAKFKTIVDSTIIPVILQITKGITNGRIKSPYEVERYMIELENTINLKFADLLN
jgi:hypothetical protein